MSDIRRARKLFLLRLGLVAIVGIGLRLLFVEFFSPRLNFGLDATWYELTSGLIEGGFGFSDPATFYADGGAVPTAFRVPLYPTFLAGITAVIGETRTTFQVAGVALGTTTIVMTGFLGRRIAGASVGIVAAALVAISPALVNVDASIMSETLQVPFVTLTVLLMYRAHDHSTPGRWAAVGLGFGACVLTRSDAMAYLGLTVLALVFVPRFSGPLRWRAALCVFVAAACVVVPWSVRNQARMGTPSLSTIDAADAFAGANCSSTYGWARLGLWDPECTRLRPPPRDEMDRFDRLNRRSWSFVADHIPQTPLVGSVRALRAWGLWDPMQQSRDESSDSRHFGWQVGVWATFLPILGLAIAGAAIARRRELVLLPLGLLVLSITVGAALTYGKQRFRVVAEPEIAILAAIALTHLGVARGSRPWRRSGPTSQPAGLLADSPVGSARETADD